MILGENNEKMSKSRGNVVNPDDIVDRYGADTLRTYEMFIGDFEKAAPWSENGVKGCKRFLDRVVKLTEILNGAKGYSPSLETAVHQTIKKVTNDIEQMKFNTAIAALMKLLNSFFDAGSITKDDLRTYLILLNPIAPHITEEIYSQCGYEGIIAEAKWPEYDEAKTVEDTIEIPVQINGKLKAKVSVHSDASDTDVKKAVQENEIVAAVISGKTVVKEIYVPGKIFNLVVK